MKDKDSRLFPLWEIGGFLLCLLSHVGKCESVYAYMCLLGMEEDGGRGATDLQDLTV